MIASIHNPLTSYYGEISATCDILLTLAITTAIIFEITIITYTIVINVITQ